MMIPHRHGFVDVWHPGHLLERNACLERYRCLPHAKAAPSTATTGCRCHRPAIWSPDAYLERFCREGSAAHPEGGARRRSA